MLRRYGRRVYLVFVNVDGECAHAVRLGCTPGRRVSRASSDHHVDQRLGIVAKAPTLLNGEGNEAVVGIASENEVTVLTDLACSGLSSSSSVDNRSNVRMRLTD